MIETALCRGKHGAFHYLPTDTVVGRSLELYGEYSDKELGLLQTILSKGDWIVEVGANIGALTVPLARAVGDEGRVIAFEPQEELFSILQKNLGINQIVNVRAERAAVGAATGWIGYAAPDYGKAGNFGAVTLGAGDGLLGMVTVDTLNLSRLRLLKIDVEGMEADVLRGARETIKRCRPLLYVENDRPAKSAELISLIFELGYRAWWHLPPLYNARNARACQHNAWPGKVSINMLCVPADVKVDINLLEITDTRADWHDGIRFDRQLNVPQAQRCGIVRPGAYGDVLWLSSILPHLKAQGYHVTVYTELQGGEILKHDPNIDCLIVNDPGQVPDMQAYWEEERPKYGRWINLVESVEGALIAMPWQPRYDWPQAARHAVMEVNYLEHAHRIAEVPFEPRVTFYPTAEETAFAVDRWETMTCGGKVPLAVIAASGSTAPKWWPHLAELLEGLANLDVQAVVLGNLKKLDQRDYGSNVHLIGTEWSIRQAITFAQFADAVVGQDTGIMNAVAFEPMLKIVLLSGASAENLTRDWRNTVSLHGSPACYPCHQIHFDLDRCTVDKETGAAACQSGVDAAKVLRHLTYKLHLGRVKVA